MTKIDQVKLLDFAPNSENHKMCVVTVLRQYSDTLLYVTMVRQGEWEGLQI